jgi:hypothetical protein
MLGDLMYKLPKGVTVSKSITDVAVAYYRVTLWGHPYYVPITKRMKKLLKMSVIKGKVIIPQEMLFEDVLREIIHAIHLQVRDDVCSGIQDHISQEVGHGFQQLFDKFIEKKVNSEVEKVMPKLEDKR